MWMEDEPRCSWRGFSLTKYGSCLKRDIARQDLSKRNRQWSIERATFSNIVESPARKIGEVGWVDEVGEERRKVPEGGQNGARQVGAGKEIKSKQRCAKLAGGKTEVAKRRQNQV